MLKNLIKTAAFALLFWSCNRLDIFPGFVAYPGYPTVIKSLSASDLSRERATFASTNPFIMSSLTKFGFCGYADDIVVHDPPPVGVPLTESEAVSIVNNFVAANPAFTGVKHPEDLSFYQISMSTGYYNGGIAWSLKTDNQKVDTIEVLNSGMGFNIMNRELTSCLGNWFPEIVISGKFNFDQKKAAGTLLNYVVGHSTIAGQVYNVTITSEDLAQSRINLKILPLTLNDEIILHVCWQYDIPGPVSYKIFVDVMTGKIVGEWPTIIS